MNKILTVVTVALVSAAAFGELSWATIGSAAYSDADPNPSQAESSAYKGYLCTVAAAEKTFGSSEIGKVTDYFVKHFSAGSSALQSLSAAGTAGAKLSGGATVLDAVEYERGQYNFTTFFTNGNLADNQTYVGILLYASDDDYAVRVFSATSEGETWRADDSIARAAGSAGKWTAAPEPTSGLLLLLGLAGLAIKRKRAVGSPR